MMEPKPRTGGLQNKFFISLLTVGIVPGIVALTATYVSSTSSLKQSIGSSFQEIARSTALRIAAAVDAEIDRAVRLAKVPVLIRGVVEDSNRRYAGKSDAAIARQLDQEERAGRRNDRTVHNVRTAAYLQDWAGKDGDYVRVVVADSRGAVVVSTDPEVPYRQAGQEWWSEAFRGTTAAAYVSTLRMDPAVKDYVFDVAVPVRGEREGGTIGVVGLTIRRKVLTDTILPIRVGETGHGMLLDTAGTPLICPVLPPTAHLIQESLVNQLARPEPLWLVAEDDAHGGHNSIIGAAPVRFAHQLSPASLGGHRWFAFVRQEPEETFAPIYSLLVTVGVIGFGLVVVLSSLGYLVGRQIVGPIRALQREAEALRRNVSALSEPAPTTLASQPAPPEVRTGDEVEELARTFYAMRTALEESIRTVKAQHEELIRRERLASVGQLLAALAHDLRNPLGVIRSSAQLVLESSQSAAVKQEVARYIIDEVDRLAHRINDFLRYARQKPPEPKSVPPEQIVQAALTQWRAQGGHEHVTVETRFRHGRTQVYVDPDQVKEALVNLLLNAREAMPGGGQLTVATRLSDGSIELEVADTGIGIQAAHLERIFEPFFTTKEYGTGLGLTNVKRLLEDNGGSLAVQSAEGKGTSFKVILPASSPTKEKTSPTNEGPR